MTRMAVIILALLLMLNTACMACPMGGQPGGTQGGQPGKPSAYIDLISPSSASYGETVSFTGHGVDEGGSVVAYRWRSSIDGDLGNQSTFASSSLSPGKHIILFSVQDNSGNWSLETQGTVNVTTDVDEGMAEPEDTTPPPADPGSSTPPATPPVIANFNAVPQNISAGGSSTLSWNVSNATVVTINNGVGSVGLTGTRVVSPASTTTYTLTASNMAFFTQAGVQVSVAPVSIARPDLIIEDIWSSSGKIYYRVRNQGTAASATSIAKLSVDGLVKATDSVPSLAAGTGSTQYFSGYNWSCSGASDTIKVDADSGSAITELNETNNSLTKTWACLSVIIPPLVVDPALFKPDLIVTNIKYVAPNKVRCTVKNQGTGNAGAFKVALYRGGALKDTQDIAGLAAGASVEKLFAGYTHLCIMGSNSTMQVRVDSSGMVAETNEANNTRTEVWGCPPPP